MFILAMSLLLASQASAQNLPEVPTPAAPAYTCSEPQWEGDARVDGDLFKGTLSSLCDITGTTGGGLATLDAFLLEGATKDATVNAGPIEETFKNLPGVRYDVTTVQGDLTIRQNVHVATDRSAALAYSTDSIQVNGSGAAAMVKKVDVAFDVGPAASGTQGSYQLKLTSTVWVEKPRFVPPGVFLGPAKKVARDQFEKARNRSAPSIVDHL